MRVISLPTLKNFWEMPAHRDAEQPLRAWYSEAMAATWLNPAELKAQFRSASILKGNRVVFNIKGNDYRLITAIVFRYQAVYVKFIGTHAEYDKVDAETVDHSQ
ncbi:MAG: type II toxin-antitoxin system HigB family toxin [Acetobacteraceae bacterium]|nr:MAG: type II toxin-antitoxin system HigB family toxin [Acetobacteraceae bacterium]